MHGFRTPNFSLCFIDVHLNTLRPRQNGRHFTDDIFKCIFLNESVWIPIKISLKFVPRGPINNIQALVQIMAWRRPGDKPLSEAMTVSLPTHICVTRPQWVNPAHRLETFNQFELNNDCNNQHCNDCNNTDTDFHYYDLVCSTLSTCDYFLGDQFNMKCQKLSMTS